MGLGRSGRFNDAARSGFDDRATVDAELLEELHRVFWPRHLAELVTDARRAFAVGRVGEHPAHCRAHVVGPNVIGLEHQRHAQGGAPFGVEPLFGDEWEKTRGTPRSNEERTEFIPAMLIITSQRASSSLWGM